jgi:orotate phosphoribosyltransferase
VEGQIEDHSNIIVIEDLISTGKSSIEAVYAINRSINVNIKAVAAIFDYGFEDTISRFAEQHLDYYAISDYDHLIEKAYQTNYLTQYDLELLKKWRQDPENWVNSINYGVKN